MSRDPVLYQKVTQEVSGPWVSMATLDAEQKTAERGGFCRSAWLWSDLMLELFVFTRPAHKSSVPYLP